MPLRWRRRRAARKVSSDEAYTLWADTYGDSPNSFQRLESECLSELMPRLSGKQVLDLGCGRGRVVREACEGGAKIAVGIDRVLKMLDRASSSVSPPGRFAAADVCSLPFPPCHFDVVNCSLVLGHVDDPGSAIEEADRVLKPGGWLLLSDFHPSASLHGWQRTFIDPVAGAEHIIEHHGHLLADYFSSFETLGLVVEALREPVWDGVPVVFVLRARKPA